MSKPYYSVHTAYIVDSLKQSEWQGILLHGPSGIGLAYAARDIASSLTKQIITIVPDEKGTISIDIVRELYLLGRTKGGLTVFIIDDADTMSIPAQNALLKLLEEPVASLRFILTSHTPARLLLTVRSRVAEYALTPISAAQSSMLLSDLKQTESTMQAQLLFIAGGLPSALTMYATTPKQFELRARSVRDARHFLQGSKEERLLSAARYKERDAAIALIDDMLKLLRRNVETKLNSDGPDTIDLLLATEMALTENASVRMSLTSLALHL